MGGKGNWWCFGLWILDLRWSWWGEEPVVPGEKLEELGLGGFGKVEDADAPGPAFPELFKGFDFVLNVLDVSPPPPRRGGRESFPGY